jgi:biliverdin reductase
MKDLKVGLVGTGYAAKLRAEALQADRRCHLVGVAGQDPARTEAFSQTHQIKSFPNWQTLLDQGDLDLLVISTVNQMHGPIAQAALTQGKHVVVEYPLALNLIEAEQLVTLAQAQNRLLHVEHIELLSGLHQALLHYLPQIGSPYFVRYTTWKQERSAPQRWSYDLKALGFPLVGALSRIHRLTHAFGEVTAVSCQARILFSDQPQFFKTCLGEAQLHFATGVLGLVSYGKGENLWRSERSLLVQGDQGSLSFQEETGYLTTQAGEVPLTIGSRRGLFAKDTQNVLDHLWEGQPLYVTVQESLSALRVADATRRAAESGETLKLESHPFQAIPSKD